MGASTDATFLQWMELWKPAFSEGKVVVHFGGADVMPQCVGEMLRRISAAITGSGNEIMYHDLKNVYEAPSSAIEFPTEFASHFSAMALNSTATSILFRDPKKVRITIFPHYQDLRNPTPQLSIHAGMRPYKNCKHVLLVPAEGEKDDWEFASSEDGTTEFTSLVKGVTTYLKVISIPSGQFLKPYLYCLLSSFIQPSDPHSKAETKKIKALLKEKYPEQYALFFGHE